MTLTLGKKNMSDLVTYVGNCLIGGDDFTEYPDGSRTRDVIRLNLNGRHLVLRQNRDFIRNRGTQDVKGSFVSVTTFHFGEADEADIPELLDLSNKLCELLSFVTESRVIAYGHDFPAEGAIRQRQSVIGTVETFRPPFTVFDGSAIKNFIEQCFLPFLQHRDARGLHVVFDCLYHAGKTGSAIEVQLASLFILLENLKHSYALQNGYPMINGFFRNIGATNAAPGGKLTFETLLNSMFAAVGMNPNMIQIIRLRNELIHSGLIAIDAQAKFALFEEIQDIIREYILRLLQFSGNYHCYSLGNSKTLP